MNKKVLISSLVAVATFAIAGMMVISSTGPSLAGIFADPSEAAWHHYHQQSPSLNWQGKAMDKGTREYWVQCGGSYQFTEPASDNKVYETGAPDTSEFTADDDRWITYCEIHDHSYDAKGVCEYCNELDGAIKIGDKAIGAATVLDEAAPLGFKSVYSATGLANGAVGASVSLAGADMVYFSIYHDAPSLIAFGGNNGQNPVLWQGDWYNILLTKDENGWVANYKKSYETTWNTDHTKVDENTGNNLSSVLKLYNWDGKLPAATVKCTEVYKAVAPHVHSADSKGICTECLELVGGTKISDNLFETALEPDNNPAAPAGFSSVTRQLAKHNTNSYIKLIDVTSYTKLYFAVYSPANLKFFSGNDNNKPFWTNRWNYIYMENAGGQDWTAYGRDPGESEFTELTGLNKSTQWRWMFSIIRTDFNTSEFNLYTTELIAL